MSSFTAPKTVVRLADVLDHLDDVTENGDGFLAICPAHNDHRPSLVVSVGESGKLLVHCRAGCPQHKVIVALGLSGADLSRVDTTGVAVKHAAVRGPFQDSYRAPLAMYLDKAAAALRERGDEAADYAERRFGISREMGRDLGLGYDDGHVPQGGIRHYLGGAERLVIPFHDFDGRPWAFQARAITDSTERWTGPSNPEGGRWGAYGVFRTTAGLPDAEVLITEGPGDALTAVGAGYNAVAIPGSTRTSPALMAELAAHLQGARVVIAGDVDDAGRGFTATLATGLTNNGVRDVYLIDIPEMPRVKDLTDWRGAAGDRFTDDLRTAVRRARAFSNDEVRADSIVRRVEGLLTDVDNARRLYAYIRANGADVKKVPGWGWIVYRGHDVGTWERTPISGEAVRGYAQNAAPFIRRSVLDEVADLEKAAMGITDATVRNRVLDILLDVHNRVAKGALSRGVQGSKGLDNMVKELGAFGHVLATREEFDDPDRTANLLAVGNGVVDLRDGSLRPFSDETKALLLVKKAAADYIPEAKCPRWDRFITEIFPGEPEVADYVQALLGYTLTGVANEAVAPIFVGSGSNGKSILVETVQNILGTYATSTGFDTFNGGPSRAGHTDAVAALAGSRYVAVSEGAVGVALSESLIKRLTGGDTMSASAKGEKTFTFSPRFIPVMMTNHLPVIKGQDHGIWRRVRLVEFSRQFLDHDKESSLGEKFRQETVPVGDRLPGDAEAIGSQPREAVLAWLVRGAVEWNAHGLRTPRTVLERTEAYREDSDVLGDFIREALVADRDASVPTSALWVAYCDWQDDNKVQGIKGRTTFFAAMVERGFRKKKTKANTVFVGVRVKTDADRRRESANNAADDVAGGGDTPF